MHGKENMEEITMNYRERFFNAMDQKHVDRVPVGFWHHFFDENWTGINNINSHIAYYNELPLDFIKIMCDGYFEYPFSTKIETVSDWKRLKPLGKDSEYVRGQVERAKIINGHFIAERACLYNVFVPFTVIRHSLGDEPVMAHLKEDPEAVKEGMKLIAEDTVTLIRALMEEAKCDGLYLPLQGGEYDRFTPEEYEAIVRPFDKMIYDLANEYSDYNMSHLCAWAGLKNRLSLWKDVPVKAVNWAVFIEELSLAEGREFFGGKTCVGGFDNRPQGILNTGTEKEIKDYTKKLIDDFGTTRGLILGADCTIPATISPDHIRWVIEAAEEYGARD